ncbi:MAG: hypothetical protein DRP55_06825 [Spirochaetes bacterium]|nr:hypothetical protein [Deltaproteobacteria bacterium]RKX99738.1 MAG: hypothetical protein DRP55_06825 [Spirochaetota bacterium]
MKEKEGIYKEGLEEYSKSGIILGNLIMILWITLGTISIWFLYPLASWIYLGVAILMIGIILRKLLCANCFYYNRWCGIGWGKLAALFFKKGDISLFGENLGQTIAPITYGLLTLIPIVFIIISIFQQFKIFKIILLLFLIFISIYSGIISRKKICANCKMRFLCKGSAVK